MSYSSMYQGTELRLLNETYRNEDGIVCWKANSFVVPPEVSVLAGKYFLTTSEVAEQIKAWDVQDAAIWADYLSLRGERTQERII